MVKVGDTVKITDPYFNEVVRRWWASGAELQVTDVYDGTTSNQQPRIRVIDKSGTPMRLSNSKYEVVKTILSIEAESQEL